MTLPAWPLSSGSSRSTCTRTSPCPRMWSAQTSSGAALLAAGPCTPAAPALNDRAACGPQTSRCLVLPSACWPHGWLVSSRAAVHVGARSRAEDEVCGPCGKLAGVCLPGMLGSSVRSVAPLSGCHQQRGASTWWRCAGRSLSGTCAAPESSCKGTSSSAGQHAHD